MSDGSYLVCRRQVPTIISAVRIVHVVQGVTVVVNERVWFGMYLLGVE